MSARPGVSSLMVGLSLIALCCAFMFLDRASVSARGIPQASDKVSQGQLRIIDALGKPGVLCPLKHTRVEVDVSGFLARVTLTQEFQNTADRMIEAVYLFPLPPRSAIDQMSIELDGRVIRGEIKRRAEAQLLFARAREKGRVAALLDQERPNIFTQSVTNILPGATVKVKISYLEMLPYENGVYEFNFPMVVGPRYIPGEQKTTADPARLGPLQVADGMRPGHDISIEVRLDTGVALEQITSELHEIEVDRVGAHQAVIRLKDKTVIPDRDFVLRYGVGGLQIADAVLAHRDERSGYFTLILQPPNRISAEDVRPKELVFVLDTSGSMIGIPLTTAKSFIEQAFEGLNEHDTFNLITFSGDTHVLFDKPVPATKENLQEARNMLERKRGGGGTEMMSAIRAALADSDSQDHIRIVCFLTDGFVGNDMEIISEVQQHPNARVFSFGIGNAVNRFLLDKMAEYGRGEVEYVFLNRGAQNDAETAAAASKRFYERVRSPLLTDISVDWNGLPVMDIYPKRLPDLFGVKPLVIMGRYTRGGNGVIRLRGKTAGIDFYREVHVDLPEAEPRHDALAALWARIRIDDLMAQDYKGIEAGVMRKDLEEAITQLGLDYRVMTQFTSFIAVSDVVTSPGVAPQRVEVPIAMPGSAADQTVMVSSSLCTDSSSRSEVGSTIVQRRLDNLPLNMQQPSELAKLAPGAAPT